jgi:3-phytase
MRSFARCLAWAITVLSFVAAQDANVTLVPAATDFDGDNTGFVYGKSPLVVVNDGSAADGGFRIFAISNTTAIQESSHQKTGRSKVAFPVHDIGGRDLIISISAPDSLIRVFDAESGAAVKSNYKKQLGDWSTACVWRSEKSGEIYFFLFGKKMVVQFLVQGTKKELEILEVCHPTVGSVMWSNIHLRTRATRRNFCTL